MSAISPASRSLFAASDVIYPQFATHNALTVAAVLELAPRGRGIRVPAPARHGRGRCIRSHGEHVPQFPSVRVYAPVGTHEDLLPYLVRRLLENGANSSFVHHFLNPDMSGGGRRERSRPEPQRIPDEPGSLREPPALYGPDRANSLGADFGDPLELEALQARLRDRVRVRCTAGRSSMASRAQDADVPVHLADEYQARSSATRAMPRARKSFTRSTPPHRRRRHGMHAGAAERAACLERAADLLEQRRDLNF